MRKSDIYEIAIRILALYLLITALHTVIDIAATMWFTEQMRYAFDRHAVVNDVNWSFAFILILGGAVLLTTGAAFFFFKANFIVRKICKPSDFEENVKLFAEPAAIYEIAFVITGMLLILWSLPEFVVKLPGSLNTRSERMFIIARGVKIILGIFVLVFARRWAAVFTKNRSNL